MEKSRAITAILLLIFIRFINPTFAARHHQSVNIINDVGETFNVHCKSEDSDLGLQTLVPGQRWGFGFKSNVWGTTLFWCDFSWGPSIQHCDVWKDIGFWGKGYRPCRQCLWDVRRDGFYRAEAGAPFAFVSPWQSA